MLKPLIKVNLGVFLDYMHSKNTDIIFTPYCSAAFVDYNWKKPFRNLPLSFIFGYLKLSTYLNLFSLKKITDLYLHVKESLSSWEKCIRNVPFLFLIKVVKLARLKYVIINNLVSLDLLRKKVPDCFSCKQLKTVNILSEPWAIISIFDKKTYLNFLSLTCKGFWNLCVA